MTSRHIHTNRGYAMNTLIIDNYDSFTYNLYQLICELKLGEVFVRLNDKVTLSELKSLSIDAIIISPGPGNPHNSDDIGRCEEIILNSGLPIFGVCLGMQCLISSSGGEIREADEPVHGQVDDILHDGSPLFDAIPSSFKAMRYHSLIATNVPDQWQICARNPAGIVMAVCHRQRPWWGVQFHPESVASEFGARLMQNFYHLAAKTSSARIGNTQYKRGETASAAPPPSNIDTQRWNLHSRLCDWVDPESAFLALYRNSSNSFWLDSSMVQDGLSRYSIMGDNQGSNAFLASFQLRQQQWTITSNNVKQVIHNSAFAWIRQFLSQQRLNNPHPELPFQGGLLGWLGYELKAECGASIQHFSKWPDAVLFFPQRFIVFDHLKQSVMLLSLLPQDQHDNQATSWFDEVTAVFNRLDKNKAQDEPASFDAGELSNDFYQALRQDYVTNVESARHFIKQGLAYELCLTRRVDIPCTSSGIDLYRRLRRHNPAPYASYIRVDNLEVLSSSPEQFLKIDPSGAISSKPIKGTIARASDPQQDLNNLIKLQNNIKDRAENLMIVDLLRNDLGRVCQTGSINVSKLLQVESYATVHQLVSQICGIKKPQLDMVDCIQAAFPGGSMTGAPKLRSMALLEQLENDWRGVYSGCTGYLSLNHSCDLSINIRDIVLAQGQAHIGSGGAVVWLSDANDEFDEMCLKAQALVEVIAKSPP